MTRWVALVVVVGCDVGAVQIGDDTDGPVPTEDAVCSAVSDYVAAFQDRLADQIAQTMHCGGCGTPSNIIVTSCSDVLTSDASGSASVDVSYDVDDDPRGPRSWHAHGSCDATLFDQGWRGTGCTLLDDPG